jgi:hypothetical protein
MVRLLKRRGTGETLRNINRVLRKPPRAISAAERASSSDLLRRTTLYAI